MCEVGERAEGGLSVLPWFIWRVNLAEPDTPGEGSAETTGFPTAEGSALLFVFDQKKKKKVSGEGLRKHPASDT